MVENLKNLIREIEEKLEFVITLSVFFPSLLYNLFKLANKTEQKSNDIVVSWSVVVSIYLLNYIVFQFIKNKVPEKLLKIFKIILLIGISSYIIPILYIAIYKNNPIHGLTAFLFKASIWGLPAIPTLLFAILLLFQPLTDIYELTRNKVKRLHIRLPN